MNEGKDPILQKEPKCLFCKEAKVIYKVYAEPDRKRIANCCINCGKIIRRYIKHFNLNVDVYTMFERVL